MKPRKKISTPKGFVTVGQAARAIRTEGLNISDLTLTHLVDKGVLSGARLLEPAIRPRIIDERVLKEIIENMKARRHYAAGFEEYVGRIKRGKPTFRLSAKKPARVNPTKAELENWEANMQSIRGLRERLFLEDKITPSQASQLDRIIIAGMYLPPAEFRKKIVPVVIKALKKK